MHPQLGKSSSTVRRLRAARPLPGRSLLAVACTLALAGAAQAQTSLSSLMVTDRGGATLAPAVEETPSNGSLRVIVQFTEPSVIESRSAAGRGALNAANRAALQQEAASLRSAKAARVASIQQLGGTVQNTLEFAFNGAVVDIAPNRIDALRRLPGVKAVEPAGIFRMNQTPPSVQELIGTLPVNVAGNGGQGVAVAILDSGVDYTHAAFAGPGTVAYYQAAVAGSGPITIGDTPGVFPNGPRVKGGYDWLGESWGIINNVVVGTVAPDPDPIDNKQVASDFAGHGTNSAGAAVGNAVPAGSLRAGSAPEAMILAYRGCSRISSACEGSALLNSIDSVAKYALGLPNEGQPGAQNPDLPAGTRFVLNMSLGASYGNPFTNALSEASRNAVRAGVTVVASAGNSNNIPYIVGTPSATDTVISVAASQPALLTGPALSVGAPLNKSYALTPGSYGVQLAAATTAVLAFAGPNTTVGNNTNFACSTVATGTANPGPADPPIPELKGGFGVSDRGTCNFSEKSLNIQRAGGTASLVVNNVVGEGPIGMAAGAAAPSVTTAAYSIGTAEGLEVRNAMSTTPGLTGTISPLGDVPNTIGGINAVDLISGFSSRGPSQAGNALKPDITAPGSNIFMANVGSGSGGNNNSGTSFSSPLTAGAAALVLSARPNFEPWQVKAALMNTTDTDVFATKTAASTTLAGLTRMGAGRVRADRAVATTTLAYDAEDVDPTTVTYHQTAASFGPRAFTAPGQTGVTRTIVVQNLSSETKNYSISVAPRFDNDLARGMVFSASASQLSVPPNGSASFLLVGTATGSALPVGANGLPLRLTNEDTCTTTANPPAPVLACTNKFDDLEQDGFVTIDGGANDTVRVPYLMYPRQASNVTTQRVGASVTLNNTGAANTLVDVFNLVGGIDPQDQPALVPGTNVLPVDLRAVGVRYLPNAVATPPAGATPDVLQFAVALWNTIDTPRIATVNIEVDTTGDGVPNFTIRNLNTTENRSAVFISAGTAGAPGNAFFRADMPLNSRRMVLSVYPAFLGGVNQDSTIGIRVRSSNGSSATNPVLDTLPNSGTFQYVKLNQMVVQPTANSFALSTGARARLAFNTNAANIAASPGDKGLMMVLAENPVETDVATIQVLP